MPGAKKNLDEAIGFEVPLEINWESLMKPEWGWDSRWEQDFVNRGFMECYFIPLTQTFASICADAMGKEAVKAGLKKIVIDVIDTTLPENSTFTDGVLRITNKPFTNMSRIDERVEGWKKLIEAKL